MMNGRRSDGVDPTVGRLIATQAWLLSPEALYSKGYGRSSGLLPPFASFPLPVGQQWRVECEGSSLWSLRQRVCPGLAPDSLFILLSGEPEREDTNIVYVGASLTIIIHFAKNALHPSDLDSAS